MLRGHFPAEQTVDVLVAHAFAPDSRGDTNWVPADQVERIEVIRGPAAARYGNGAAGGVVNIITKQPGTETHGSATIYHNFAQHKEEGETERMNFGLNGPITDTLSYRVYGNIAKTDADDADINSGHESTRYGNQIGTLPAGREGVPPWAVRSRSVVV